MTCIFANFLQPVITCMGVLNYDKAEGTQVCTACLASGLPGPRPARFAPLGDVPILWSEVPASWSKVLEARPRIPITLSKVLAP